MITNTPEPPYYAVIFTSRLSEDIEGYADTATRMQELAQTIEGYLGMETARQDIGITVSYWRTLDSIREWKVHLEHAMAQIKGKEQWYSAYSVRIVRVERAYDFGME